MHRAVDGGHTEMMLITKDLKDFGRNGCESVIFADIDRNTGNG